MDLRRNNSHSERVTLTTGALLLWAGIVVGMVHADAPPKPNIESQNLSALMAMSPEIPDISCPIVMSLVASPNAIPGSTGLRGVDALAPNDVWAAGSDLNGTLIEHWNGTSWRVLPDPGPGVLLDIEVLSPADVWVVGVRDGSALTAHWNGISWTTLPNQISGTLNRVSAVSSYDIWAVGETTDGTLIMHWNGSQWTRTISPNVGELFGVEAISANDVWAVGSVENNRTTVTIHWNGADWSRIPSPNPSSGYGGAERNVLHSIEAITANDVWAVGYTGYDEGTGGRYTTLAMHWNGMEWRVVPTPPNVGTGPNFLLALSASSSNDIWAVGNYYNFYNQVSYTLILHWNGTNWSITPTLSTTETHHYLYGVMAIAGGDVWSVGEYGPSPAGYNKQVLIQRWNGTQWTIASTPVEEYSSSLRGAAALAPNRAWAVGSYHLPDGTIKALFQVWQGSVWQSHRVTVNAPSSLSAVAAISQIDAWAVGYYTDQRVDRTLAVRYNSDVADQRNTPNVGVYSNYLTSVEVVSATDVWAVGYYQLTSDPSQTRSLVAHWNGGEWSLVSTPDNSNASRLDGIAAVSATDIWAVGRDNDRSFAMHWDGSQWRIIPTPNVAAVPNVLMAVATAASDDVWAVGHSGLPQARQALALHWDGISWNIAPNPNVGTSNFLLSVAALSENNLVAVGAYLDNGIMRTLVEHWDGVNWNLIPSPNANSEGNYFLGVVAASPTEAWAVGTYQAGALQRPLTTFYKPLLFSDVPMGSAFYVPVTCLLCRGLISGYADGTFRPNNQVTRGQLAKIVSNAAEYTESPEPQIFKDVPSSNTFYQWINRLARRGHMSGYLCGGVGEPCTTGMPYFRPSANATRGQTSKIVSNAASYTEIPTEQTFEDVPPTHTFYREIQRLASRNIMQGYPCGGVGEPCISGKPYFRPFNNVTRGQSAKIVANTFYPGCQTH